VISKIPHTLLIAALVAISGGRSASADTAAPAGIAKVTEVEGVTEYRLANGLQILLFPDASKPTVTVNVTYHVGSRMENYGETGMAHLLEHLMFKSSKSFANIGQELSKRGMQFNGSTFFDRTNYFETFPTDPQQIDWALAMETERMTQANIVKTDLDPEMTVVRNEMELGENNPFRILWQRMAATAYEWHNYGHSPIGARSDVENVNIAHLQAFYQRYYQPDNATLIVAGHFDQAQVLATIGRGFGALPKPARTIDPTWTLDPVQDGERMVTLRRVGAEQIVAALYHTAAGPAAESAALYVIDKALTDTPNGRLHKRLIEAGKAKAIQSLDFGLAEPGYLLVGATLRTTDNLGEVRNILLDTLEGLAKEPISADELRRAKQQAANEFEQTMDNPQAFATDISGSIAQGDWRLLFLDRDRIEKLNLDDVNRVATTWLKPSNRTLGLFVPTDAPDRVPAPVKADVAAIMKDFKGGKTIAAGEDFVATPENIEARAQRITLPSGLKIVLVPKKTRGETVTVHLQTHFGNETNLKGMRMAGNHAGAMLMRGTQKHTRAQLSDLADALHLEWSIGGSVWGGSADLQTKREHLADALKLAAEVLREPAFPADEFEQLRHQSLGAIEAASKEPQRIANLAISRYLFPYPSDDSRYAPTFEEQIRDLNALKLADVKSFYERYWGANHAEVVVVGDFDPAAVKAQLTTLFGNWKSAADYARVPGPMSDAKAERLLAQTPDKANAVARGSLQLPLRDDDADYPALIVAVQVLGQNSFDNRLILRLRTKDGLSYGAGASLQVSEFEPSGHIEFQAIYAPQNRAKVEAAFKEETERFARDGITAAELVSAKKAFASARANAFAEDGFEARELARLLRMDRTLSRDADLEKAVAGVTVDQVNAAIKKWIHPEKTIWSLAGDFAKTEDPAAKK
jgi:zinc protease